MKKAICLFAAVLFLSVTTQSFAQLKFGAVAGLNMASMNGKGVDAMVDQGLSTKTTFSFNVGGIAEYSLSDVYGLNSGLILSGKGLTLEKGDVTNSITPLYLEIPVNAYYKLNVGNYKVHLFAGPYLAFGIGGKIKTTGTGTPNDKSADIKFGSAADSNLASTDFGLNIGAGIEVSNMLISLQYGMGLSNIAADGKSEDAIKNSVLGLSVAYMFGSK